jgi:putative colanic acid biosynthesis acetyltransferase WcaF
MTGEHGHQTTMADQDLIHRSPWSLRQRVGRLLWALVQASLFRCSPHNAYLWRATLLRLFGARLGHNARVRRTVRIEIPWHISIGPNASVGDFAVLYSLGEIKIGKHVTISQYAHLCAGTHETRSLQMELICLPVNIGDDAWIATDAFVGPGVTIGARTILGARSSAFKDLPADVIAVGNPAKPIKPRVLEDSDVKV